MIKVKHAPYRGYGTNCYVTQEHDFARLQAICRRSNIKLDLKSSGLGAYFTVRENHIAWFSMMVDLRSA
jgi:hypothetical protein